MGVTMYCMDGSPPCHTVYLAAKLLKVDLDLKNLDYFDKEHLAPDFLKLNPQHIVPTIVDGELILWESRAICRYLVNKYGAGSKLYPQDAQARALVDQRLDFDYGMYETIVLCYFPQFFAFPTPREAELKKLRLTVGFLNTLLEGRKYVAGSDFTIADCAIASSVAVMQINDDIVDVKAYPNIARWFDMVKATVPEYQETIGKGVEILKSILAEMPKDHSGF